MRQTFRKALALALCLCLVGALAACGKKDEQETPDPSPSVEPTQTVEADFLPDNKIDVAQELLGFPGDTTLFTVNGLKVDAEEYLYWLGNMTSYYEMMMAYSGGSLNLDDQLTETMTWDQQLKEIAYQNCLLLALTPAVAAEYGVTLTDDDRNSVLQQRESNIQNAGGEERYAYQLQAMGINDSTAYRLDTVSTLFTSLQDKYTQLAMEEGNAESITAQEMADYLKEQDLLRAKHILFKTVDDDRQPYDDETIAQKKAQAEDVLAQLKADPAKFDELMNEYSEDTGLATNPDGYLFGAGEMVEEFENGTRALAVGEISGIVESVWGYHIILRLDADCDQSRQEYATQKFNDMMNQRIESAVVEKMEEYDAFTTKDYYEALVEFQAGLEEPDTQDQSNATLEPQPTTEP